MQIQEAPSRIEHILNCDGVMWFFLVIAKWVSSFSF